MNRHAGAFDGWRWRRAAGGLTLGVALALVNQGDRLFSGAADPGVLLRAALTILGIAAITIPGWL